MKSEMWHHPPSGRSNVPRPGRVVELGNSLPEPSARPSHGEGSLLG
ncbi:MAG: hypothetical protein ACI814_001801 [Mariniblastus sp.]|jgi:hypothetical protein